MTSSRRNSQSTWGFGGQRARCNLGRWKASGATTYSNLLLYSCPQVVWWVLRSLKFADPARLGLLADGRWAAEDGKDAVRSAEARAD